MSRLAVLGLGNLGRGVAADLARRGHDVAVWNRSPAALEELRVHGLEILGDEPASVEVRLEPDMARAVEAAEVVVVTTPAYGHATVFDELCAVVRPEQLVVLLPGNLGSLAAQQRFAVAGRRAALVECAVPPLASRQAGPGGVVIPLTMSRMPVAVAPGTPSAEPLATVRALWPQSDPVDDILDAFLLNPTYVIHPGLTVVSAGAVEHFYADGGFDVQAAGTTPATRRVVEAIDDERVRIREAFGYRAPHHRLATSYFDSTEPGLFGPAVAGARAELARWKRPVGLEHRYLLEDVAHGLSGLRRLGRSVGVPTPVTDAVSTVAGALIGRQLDRDPDGFPSGSRDEVLAAVAPEPQAVGESPR